MPDGLTDAMNPLGTSPGPVQPIPMAPPQVPQQQSSPLSGQLTPPAQSNVPALQPPDPAVIKHVGKLASIGHVFNTLAGTANDYQIDPKTGQTVATPIKQKPGQMFRNMLAGALMGGAAGAGGDFATGLARGGAAGVQEQQRQDLQRRAQAETQFKNQLASNEEQRKQQEFNTQQELSKAQIAHANLAVVRENQLIQNESFDFHTKAATWGKAQLDPILNSGVKPVYKDVPETEMNDMIKNAPGASVLKWYASGVKTGIGTDGKPTYEETYTAINPTEKITVTQGVINSWKEAGLDKYRPDLFERKAGYELDPQSYISLSQRAHELLGDKMEREKTAAQTDEAKARAQQARAAAAKDYAERDNYLEGKNKAGAFNKALKNLNEKGSFDKLDAGDKLVLAESGQKAADAALKAFQIAKTNLDEDAAAKALKDYEFYNGLTKEAYGASKTPEVSGPNADKAQTRGQALFNQFPNQIDAGNYIRQQIQSGAITEAESQQIMKAYMAEKNKAKAPENTNAPTGLESNAAL